MATFKSISRSIASSIIRNNLSRNVFSNVTFKLDKLTYSNTGLTITDEDKLKILDMIESELNKYAKTIRATNMAVRNRRYLTNKQHGNKPLQLRQNKKNKNMVFLNESRNPTASFELIKKIRAGYKNGK